ncbi:MAG: DUF4157 domain-containing protein [Blastocatellia bacterium]
MRLARQVNKQVNKEDTAGARTRHPSIPAAHFQKPAGGAGLLLGLQRTHGNHHVRRLLNGAAIQRKCACGGACAKCQSGSAHHNQNLIPNILQRKGAGQSLEPGVRDFMETRFREDFSGVRVHTDAHAAQTARQLNAVAYTVGRDIFFGNGQYRPQMQEGRRLLAHELTHVTQQQSAGAALLSPMNGGSADRFEREAEAVSNAVGEGQVSVVRRTNALSVQRQGGGGGGGAAAPTTHRFVAEGVNVVVRRSCAPAEFGFATVEAATRDALNQIFNSECIEETRRDRIQRNLLRHGLDIRCRASAAIGGACAEATGFSIPANIMTIGSEAFPGHPDNTGRCPGDIAPSVVHEIVHLTRGVFAEGLPDSCENSCFPGSDPTSPDLCQNIDVFGRRVRPAP